VSTIDPPAVPSRFTSLGSIQIKKILFINPTKSKYPRANVGTDDDLRLSIMQADAIPPAHKEDFLFYLQ
jgi:hypothetical protein